MFIIVKGCRSIICNFAIACMKRGDKFTLTPGRLFSDFLDANNS